MVSFQLTEADIKDLEKDFSALETQASEILDKLPKLQDKEYTNRDDLLSAFMTQVPTLTAEDQRLIVKYAEQPLAYMLTDRSFSALKESAVPDNILRALQPLTNTTFATQEDLVAAAKAQIGGLTRRYRFLLSRYASPSTTYRLTGASFKKLGTAGIPAAILEQAKQLKDSTYPNAMALEQALQGQITETTEKYVALAIKNAETQTTYALTKDSFEALKTNKIPDHIIQALQQVKDKTYPTKDELKNAILVEMQKLSAGYLPLVVKHAKMLMLYKLREKSFQELKAENVPDNLLAQLRALEGKWYFREKTFSKAVEMIIQQVTAENQQYVSPIAAEAEEQTTYTLSRRSLTALQSAQVPDALMESLGKLKGVEFAGREQVQQAVSKAIQTATEQYNRYPALIAKEATAHTTYTLSSESFKELNEKNVPSYVLESILPLTILGSANTQALASAIEARLRKVRSPYDQYLQLIAKHAERRTTYRLDDKAANELKAELEAAMDPGIVITGLKKLEDIEFVNAELFKQALTEKVPSLSDEHKALIVNKARKEHPYTGLKDIRLTGGTCGCVLDDLSGDVYGFYPFWLAGDEQQLDFSVLTRIGYFALPFDQEGNITETLHWQKGRTRFIEEADRHKTWVDLVIYNHDWRGWEKLSPDDKAKRFKNLRENIVKMLNDDVTSPSLIKTVHDALPPWGGPTRVGGVTLYFKGYPDDQNSINAFVAFVKQLKTTLRKEWKIYSVNIMLPMGDLLQEGGMYSYNHLKGLVPKQKKGAEGYEDEDYVDRFLVFLDKPTTEKKKELRAKIEEKFSGIQRRNMFRKVIPVITPRLYDGQEPTAQEWPAIKLNKFLFELYRKDDPREVSQTDETIGPHTHSDQDGWLRDDITYFEDNFGGVGLWPVPISKPGEAAEGMEVYLTDPCRFVCPNRWAVRVLWDLLFAGLLLYAGASYWVCELRRVCADYFWYCLGYVVAALALFFLMQYCDPYWQKRQGVLFMLFVLGGVVYGIVAYLRRMKRAQAP